LQLPNPYCKKHNTIAQPGVTAAIVAARDAAQCKENLKASNIKLSSEQLAEIGRHLETLELKEAAPA
jgi:aryl-alcohol dehydrogenase-like predicted oxidoreductase